ncbi:MAG TPA: MerR family transcriptional regulator [Paenibacillus sp.]|nr:MerR family transcriptional regulator [Paenibacillus sp.]
MRRTWTVGQLAKLTGLTIRALRFYDGIGLFSPSEYSDAGYRIYTEEDITRLQQILSLKELGMSLDEMKAFVAGDSHSLADTVTLHIARLKERIAVQQKLLRELETVSDRMRRNEPLTVEHYANLMRTMRMNHGQTLDDKKASWNDHLDRLGAYLDEQPPGEPPGQGGTTHD